MNFSWNPKFSFSKLSGMYKKNSQKHKNNANLVMVLLILFPSFSFRHSLIIWILRTSFVRAEKGGLLTEWPYLTLRLFGVLIR